MLKIPESCKNRRLLTKLTANATKKVGISSATATPSDPCLSFWWWWWFWLNCSRNSVILKEHPRPTNNSKPAIISLILILHSQTFNLHWTWICLKTIVAPHIHPRHPPPHPSSVSCSTQSIRVTMIQTPGSAIPSSSSWIFLHHTLSIVDCKT